MHIRSLKNFLALNFMLVAILPLLMVSILSLALMRQSLKQTIANKNLAITRTLAGEVDLFLQEPIRLLQQVRDVIALQNGNGRAIDAHLRTVIDNYRFFDMVQIVADNGRVKHMAPLNQDIVNTDMSGQEFFIASKISLLPYWSKTFISLQTGYPAVTVSLPMENDIIVGYLNLGILSIMATTLSDDTQGKICITDHKGVVIAHTDPHKVLQRTNLMGTAEVRAGSQEKEGTFVRVDEDNPAKNKLASVSLVGKTGWLVLYHEDIALAYAPLYLLNKLLFAALVLSVITAILLAVLVMKKAMQPITQLLSNTRKITQGDYNLHLPPTDFSEVKKLTEQFAAMAGAVEQREQNLRYRSELDSLISNISTELISLPPDGLEQRIQQALAEIGTFLGVDRSYIFLLDQKKQTMICRFQWFAEETPAHLQELRQCNLHHDFPWFEHTLQHEPVVHVPCVAELPPQAAAEKKVLQQDGIQSLLYLPMFTGETMTGFIGFDSVSTSPSWPHNLLIYLRILAELFTNAIEREQADFILKRLQTAIDQARDAIAILDAEGVIQFVNPAFTAITGFSRNQVLSEPITHFLLPRDQHSSQNQPIGKALAEGKHWSGHFSGKRSDGHILDQDITFSPIHHGRDLNGYVFVSRDVTEELQLQAHLQQSQKMESIGTLAGGIAHDFNNILSAIIGHAELADMTPKTPAKVEKHLQQILVASKRASGLVRQILTFSRRSGQQNISLQIQPIVKESLKLLRASLPATIEIRQNITKTDPIQADPTQIHQVVMNLCANAFHAMEEKGGILTVNLYPVTISNEPDEPSPAPAELKIGDYVLLSIADNGPGIPADIAERIFEPYFTTKEQGKGTGLGLAVVHGIVSQAGGIIQVQSQPDKGTIFNLYFPVTKAEAGQPHIEENLTAPAGTGHILVVDDEEMLGRLLNEMLTNLGYRVTVETNSVKALEQFRAQADNFDLILTDMTMPNMTGLDLAEQILQIRPHIPIILCSGYSEGLDPILLKKKGIDGLLHKPFDRARLARIIAKGLSTGTGNSTPHND